MVWYNNFSYHNGYLDKGSDAGTGFRILNASQNKTDRVLRNNLSYADEYAPVTSSAAYTHSHNNWDISVNVTDDDFISLDYTQLYRERKPDGSLPDITFGKLASNSELVDLGMNVGLPYYGSNPDLGWHESSYNNNTPSAPTAPVYVSSVIEHTTPTRLEMTYNLTLASIIPATSAFAVRVNNVTRNVTSVAISGTKVLLTLASPVVYGDAVTVAYTKPASNPLQTVAGGQAATIAAQIVINNVGLVNQPPVVTISSPTKSTSFIAPATITIEAVASDPDGNLSKVEFYQGAVKIGELASASTFSFLWKDVPEGTYSLTAAAIDAMGLKTVSPAVSVTVEKSATSTNQLPVVNITLAKNKKPKKHENVIIIAEASDPDGTISKVELKSGGNTIAELTSAPYIFTLTNVDTGHYEIQALAYDNIGAVSNSATLQFFVENRFDYDSDMISLFPNPNDGNFNIEVLSEPPIQECILTIVNLSGQPFYKEIMNRDTYDTELSLQDIPSGVYVVILSSGKTILSTKKFIKS
ncbi:MAG TPA: hypothetical protein DDW27_04575 [Bacteroidales bacterium]|nr:hypothetical protein [Bacteroidales bacterium]